MNWKELAADSPFRTAVAVEESLQRGETAEAALGIQQLREALSRSDKRAIKGELIRLMVHIIKWHTQPEKRSRSWRASIRGARREIADLQEETPSLNRAALESIWQDAFESAKDEAEGEMNRETEIAVLRWEQVFEESYDL